MCASYGLQALPDDVFAAFGVEPFAAADERGSAADVAEWLGGWLAEHDAKPVRPTGRIARNLNPIVRERATSDESAATTRTLDPAWWTLWVGGAPAKFPAINARVERLLSSGAWAGPTKTRRALIPVTEYYERGAAFRIDDRGSVFALAGIWNVAFEAPDRPIVSYALVTRDAHPHVFDIHDRMPLIVTPEHYDAWLDPTRVADDAFLDEVRAASDTPAASLQIIPR